MIFSSCRLYTKLDRSNLGVCLKRGTERKIYNASVIFIFSNFSFLCAINILFVDLHFSINVSSYFRTFLIKLSLSHVSSLVDFCVTLTHVVANQVDRIDILRLTLEDKLCVPGDMNWNYYGNKTEGWMLQDIVDLAEKARFVALKRHGNEIHE